MSTILTLSVDAMGGDHAPDMVVEGVKLARERFPRAKFLLFGDEVRLAPMIARDPALSEACEVRHADSVVTNDDKPSTALRTGRRSSMRLAIDAVASGEAAGVVSAGNTGALMAMAKFVLKTLPGIDRPAIASFIPTITGESVMLDLGANVDCDAANLLQFAVMGQVFARTVLGIERPTIGLLNVGAEDLKGNDAVKGAAALLRASSLSGQFKGFVEGNDIAEGTVDVVVTDGFTGNVALKTAEGTVKLYSHFLRQAFTSSLVARLGYLLAKPALHKLRVRTDPRRYNGAMFLGLNGICVKSHGGTDALGFANALGVAIDMVTQGFNERIKDDFRRLNADPASQPQAAAL